MLKLNEKDEFKWLENSRSGWTRFISFHLSEEDSTKETKSDSSKTNFTSFWKIPEKIAKEGNFLGLNQREVLKSKNCEEIFVTIFKADFKGRHSAYYGLLYPAYNTMT